MHAREGRIIYCNAVFVEGDNEIIDAVPIHGARKQILLKTLCNTQESHISLEQHNLEVGYLI